MNKSRKTIGIDPLDEVIPHSIEVPVSAGVKQPGTNGRVTKERMTIHVSTHAIDRIKNAVYWTPGLTLADLAERALVEAVEALERERGQQFPPRKAELRGGRPMR